MYMRFKLVFSEVLGTHFDLGYPIEMVINLITTTNIYHDRNHDHTTTSKNIK